MKNYDKNITTNEIGIINMAVKDDSTFLSPFSNVGKAVISKDVADFIENSAKEFHPNTDLTLNIYSNEIDENEKILYKQAIVTYFNLKITDINREIKRKNIISTIFLSIGIIALTFMVIFHSLYERKVISEFIDIFAWVFIWEAVDQFFIEKNALIIQKKRLTHFTTMTINYYDL